MLSIDSSLRHRLVMVGLASLLACPIGLVHAQTSMPSPNPSTPGAPPAPPRGDGPHGPMHGPGGMHMMRDVERLKTSLRLDPKQTALWERAVDRMKPAGDMREQVKARRDRMTAMLDDPGFDPRKLAADMDRQQVERDTQHKATRDAWIDVYESLNPVQRGQVREFMRSHLAAGPFMHRPAGWMHRDGPHDDRGRSAPSATPAPTQSR